MGIARGANLTAIRLVGAIRHQINPKLTFGRLHSGIDLTGGHFKTFRIKLEVMNERFHGAFHLTAFGRHDFVIDRRNWPPPALTHQKITTLLHDPHRLAHLLHADQITVITIPMLANGNIKFQLLIALIRLGFAQIPRRPRTAHHHPGKAPGPTVVQRHHPDIDIALFKDTVVGQKPFKIVTDL